MEHGNGFKDLRNDTTNANQRGECMRIDESKGKAELPRPQLSQPQGQQFEPLLDEVQAGKLLGLHPKTLQRLARQCTVPAIRLGRYWRFRASSLNTWIELQSTGQPLTERTQ